MFTSSSRDDRQQMYCFPDLNRYSIVLQQACATYNYTGAYSTYAPVCVVFNLADAWLAAALGSGLQLVDHVFEAP